MTDDTRDSQEPADSGGPGTDTRPMMWRAADDSIVEAPYASAGDAQRIAYVRGDELVVREVEVDSDDAWLACDRAAVIDTESRR